MAVCDHCDQEMTTPLACTWKPTLEIEGAVRARIAYPPNGAPTYPPECQDCKTPQGGLHHPGCDTERCPGCGGQAISCDCHWEGDEDEDDGDTCPAVLELVQGMPMPCDQPRDHEPPHQHGQAGVAGAGASYARWSQDLDGTIHNEEMRLP